MTKIESVRLDKNLVVTKRGPVDGIGGEFVADENKPELTPTATPVIHVEGCSHHYINTYSGL